MFKKDKDNKIVLGDSKKELPEAKADKLSVAKESMKIKFSLPKQVMIGFYANIKKSDLKSYLRAKASNHMLPDNTYFGIRKYQNGYLWELHEGGSGRGVLSSLVEKLETDDFVIIETSDRNVKVLKKSVGEGISSFALNSDDIISPTEGIEFKDKLTPVKTTGFGFFVISSIYAGLGVFSAVGLLIFKYGLFHQPEPLKFVNENKELPVFQIDQVHSVLIDPNSYLYQLTYKKDVGWYMDKKEETVEEDPAKNEKLEEELEKQLEGLKNKLNLEETQEEGPNKEGESNE